MMWAVISSAALRSPRGWDARYQRDRQVSHDIAVRIIEQEIADKRLAARTLRDKANALVAQAREIEASIPTL